MLPYSSISFFRIPSIKSTSVFHDESGRNFSNSPKSENYRGIIAKVGVFVRNYYTEKELVVLTRLTLRELDVIQEKSKE